MKRVVFCCILSFLVVNLWAFDGLPPTHKHFGLQQQVFSLVRQNWRIQDLLYMLSQNDDPVLLETYYDACEVFRKQTADMGKKILAHAADPSREAIKIISDIYKSLDVPARVALYPALGYLKTAVATGDKVGMTEEEFREYFPGYGYTEPGYKYRKGREIDRETKGVTWQSEEHSITTTINVELTITVDLLNILSGMVSSGVIKNLKVSQPFEVSVNGQPLLVCKATFQVVKAIVTKTNRKFEVNKIWFELLRAKIEGWTTGPWEVCGKTYEIISEPTGEEIVTNIAPR